MVIQITDYIGTAPYRKSKAFPIYLQYYQAGQRSIFANLFRFGIFEHQKTTSS